MLGRRKLSRRSPALTARVKYARLLLEDLTPLKTDCGRACGGACCESAGTMHLLPGEEALCTMFTLVQGGAGPEMTCDGTCDRKDRPFACRVFPLTYRFDRKTEGKFRIAMEPRGRGLCPLAMAGAKALDPAFVEAARRAGEVLSDHPYTRQWLVTHAQIYDAYREMAAAFGR